VSTIRASIVTFALAAFAVVGLNTAAVPAAEAAINIKECLQVMRRDGNYLVCGNKVYKYKSTLGR
jgi:hypothetical protein